MGPMVRTILPAIPSLSASVGGGVLSFLAQLSAALAPRWSWMGCLSRLKQRLSDSTRMFMRALSGAVRRSGPRRIISLVSRSALTLAVVPEKVQSQVASRPIGVTSEASGSILRREGGPIAD